MKKLLLVLSMAEKGSLKANLELIKIEWETTGDESFGTYNVTISAFVF